jgi:hypothetical protein
MKVKVNQAERARVLAANPAALRNAELAAAQTGALRSRTIEGERRKRRACRTRRERAWRKELS